MSAEKKYMLCTFALHGPGVPLIIKIVAEMESSDDLRSELCCLFLSGVVWVKSYDSSKFVKWLTGKVLCSLKITNVPVVIQS